VTAPQSILIVDDDLDILEAMQSLLSSLGYQVLTAEDGRAALAVLRSQRPLPGLILLDLMMPTMTGWEFREEQSRDPHLSKIPVILLSGKGRLSETASELGVSEFLDKPADGLTLLSLVARYCGAPA
jgi:CheY-like chemotaxis protein